MRLAGASLAVGFLPLLWAAQYDVIIRGARVVDGSGKPALVAVVAVEGDSIAAVGASSRDRGRLEIEARGLILAPAFIDIHTHARHGLFRDPAATNYVRQGVATLLEGHDGNSPLPLGRFLAEIDRLQPAVNFGTFAGQGTIRQAVLGLANRRASPKEIRKMEDLLAQAMRDGAFGLSTGLLYVPGNYTPTEEIVALARVAARFGGIYISHIRDEAAGVLDSVRETIRIGEEAGIPVQVTHHKIVGRANWGRSEDTIRLIEQARARGVDITVDQYPYTASMTSTSVLFPQWSLEGGYAALAGRLRDPRQRARLKPMVVERILTDRGGGDPRNIVLADCPHDPSLNGKDLAAVTAARGRTSSVENAADTVMDLQQLGGCAAIFHAYDERDVERILRFPFTMVASDGEIPLPGGGVPHPRSYGTFARVLGRYARQRGILTLEEAVRKMTSLPAWRLGLKDRGLIQPGMKADLVIFDPATIADRATFENPRQYAAGVRHLFVNGRPVILNGKLTDEHPGRVLRLAQLR